MEHITQIQARQLSLFAQWLSAPPKINASIDEVKKMITHLGVVQIDTINIVARSPYFSMWSRLGNYDPDWINQLLADQQIFEGWAHMASFLPIEDFPLHRRLVLEGLRLPWYQDWYLAHKFEVDAVLSYVKDNGPVRSSDFKRQDGQRGTWWNWKFEKSALEYWFTAGELMISKRVNFQRVYDLRERVLPDWQDQNAPDLESTYRSLVLKSISAMGFALDRWVADYFRLPKKEVNNVLQKLLEEKSVIQVQVEGWEQPGLVLPDIWEEYQKKRHHFSNPQITTLLSPFDSLIWDRERTRRLFNFNFSIECYLPAAKRKYGYFLIPILHNGELIGRIDAKAHRKEGVFEVKSLYLEPDVKPTKNLANALVSAFQSCAEWHKTPDLQIGYCSSTDLLKLLKPMVSIITR